MSGWYQALTNGRWVGGLPYIIVHEMDSNSDEIVVKIVDRSIEGVRLRRRAFVNGAARASPPSGFNP
jgi:hypothetical protein